MSSTDHVPRLCPGCTGPLTARLLCTRCQSLRSKLRAAVKYYEPALRELADA